MGEWRSLRDYVKNCHSKEFKRISDNHGWLHSQLAQMSSVLPTRITRLDTIKRDIIKERLHQITLFGWNIFC